MRLLLLLSALLAALTGAGATARPVGAAVVSAGARVAQPERVRAHAHVLLATRPSGVAVAEPVSVACRDPRPAPARLWTQRRRE